MNCNEFQKCIDRFIDKELNEEMEYAFKDHIEKCEKCRKAYEDIEKTHNALEELFAPKEAPMGMEARIIHNLPEQKKGSRFRNIFFRKKTCILLAPVLLIVIFIGINNFRNISLNSSRHEIITKFDMVAMVRVNNIKYYLNGDEVITDEKVIDKEIAVVEASIDENGKLKDEGFCASTIAKVGTKVYSIKGLSEKEAVALKIHGNWEIFRVRNGSSGNSYPIFTEDMIKAEKIVVQDISNQSTRPKEITDKDIITKIALAMKNAEKEPSIPSFYGGGMRYEYYFVTRGSDDTDNIVNKYFITMQDISLNGYIDMRGNCSYRVAPEINRLITSPFGDIASHYDEKLGGKQQIYEASIGVKIIFRKLIKEEPSIKSEITVLNNEDKIWQNGIQVKDNLKGKYKLQIIMKDTTVQKSVIEKVAEDISKVHNLAEINFTQGSTKDTLVIYICFNSKPEYDLGDSGDSLVIEVIN